MISVVEGITALRFFFGSVWDRGIECLWAWSARMVELVAKISPFFRQTDLQFMEYGV